VVELIPEECALVRVSVGDYNLPDTNPGSHSYKIGRLNAAICGFGDEESSALFCLRLTMS
jgi:hypothetical protein